MLSNGHACALQYCMLHLTGYDVGLEDLKQFRQLHSRSVLLWRARLRLAVRPALYSLARTPRRAGRTPGHPENFLTPGVEVSTGPLGQGISNAVGLAIAESRLASEFNRDGSARLRMPSSRPS